MAADQPPGFYQVPPNSQVTLDQLLNGYKVYTLYDQSGSMKAPVSRDRIHVSRWQALQEAASAIGAAVDMIDPEGSTVVFFSDGISTYTHQSAEQIHDLFQDLQPGGLTNLNAALKWTFQDILRAHKTNPDSKALIVVVTDGQPYTGDHASHNQVPHRPSPHNHVPDNHTSDERTVADTIVSFTHAMTERKMNDDQVGISLLQIGHDSKAQKYLQWLDDELVGTLGASLDIVDTKAFDEVERVGGLIQALCLAFND
jgi:uncharacterized protein with von Willebrand factor type A (vWA) domain